MNARRAEMRRAKAAWKKNFQRVAAEAAGLWQAEIIRGSSAHRRETVTATVDWMAALARGENLGLLCLTCDTEFSWPAVLPGAMFFIAPHSHNPKSCSISGICKACAALPDREVIQRAMAVWRRVLPDMRKLDAANLHVEGGRA